MSEANWELIVHRLDTIVKGQDEFNKKLQGIDERLMKIDSIKQEVEVLREWKKSVDAVMPVSDMKSLSDWREKIDEVVSPSQLKEHIDELENLKIFKTRATMIWVVIQAVILIVYLLNDVFNVFK